jgi:hypothetical protein
MTRPMFIKGLRPLDPNAVFAPLLFYGMKQQVFTFIWNDPGCTAMEIAGALYPNAVDNHRAVHAHITTIAKALLKHTPWQLLIKRSHDGRVGQPPRTYKIIKRTTANARPDLTTGLS